MDPTLDFWPHIQQCWLHVLIGIIYGKHSAIPSFDLMLPLSLTKHKLSCSFFMFFYVLSVWSWCHFHPVPLTCSTLGVMLFLCMWPRSAVMVAMHSCWFNSSISRSTATSSTVSVASFRQTETLFWSLDEGKLHSQYLPIFIPSIQIKCSTYFVFNRLNCVKVLQIVQKCPSISTFPRRETFQGPQLLRTLALLTLFLLVRFCPTALWEL